MRKKNSGHIFRLTLLATAMWGVALTTLVVLAGPGSVPSGDGIFGPPIAVPRTVNVASSTAPKPANLIDQPSAEADRKSAGCIECHKGIEDMHA